MAQPFRFVLTPQETEAAEIVVIDPVDPRKLPSFIDRKVSLGLAPISGINVGAVGLGSSNVVLLGINVELPGLPLHHSIHAVQFLVTNAALISDSHLRYVALSADDSVFNAPCGHCCQFLQEIGEAPKIKIFIKDAKKNENEYVNLETLLPRPDGLLPEVCPLLLQPRQNGLTFLEPDSAGDTKLKSTALAAANKSFAPYSKCPSGVALKDCDGEVYKGWYMESAAFNPSIGPVQAALVEFVIRSGGKGFEKIVEAVLVEKKDANVSQEKTAKMIIETIAATNPKCVFKVFHCVEPVKP